MNKKDEEDYEIYRKVIDSDFSRFIRLEKAWIANISHKIMPTYNGFEHEDRSKMRKLLLLYLKKKIKWVSPIEDKKHE